MVSYAHDDLGAVKKIERILDSGRRKRGLRGAFNFLDHPCSVSLAQLRTATMSMETKGDDAWLPSSFGVDSVTEGAPTKPESVFTRNEWPDTLWFSTDSRDWGPPRTVQSQWRLDAQAGEP
jgi:hypothetical protein